MTGTTIGITNADAAPSLDRLTGVLLLTFVAAIQISIVAAEVLLAALVVCWAAGLVRDRSRPAAPAFFLAFLAYAALTLVSTAFSVDPRASLVDSKELLLFLVVPIVFDLARGPRARTVLGVVITVGAVAAAYGIVQYAMLHYDSLGQRPRGTLGHYMTYSGALMLVIGVTAARLVFGVRDRAWAALVMPALVVALTLTLTRSAWVGTCLAVGLLFILKDFRLTALVPVVVALLFALAPDSVTSRMVSMFDLQDPTNRDRLAMMRSGSAMVRDHPLLGVGPDMVERLYPEYRDARAVQETNPHLHNVPLQIAAERGLPALAAWVAAIGLLTVGLFRLFHAGGERTLPAGGLAAVVGMLAAGFFEYNFGDSEFLLLFLVLVTLPFAAARRDDAAPTARA